MTMSAADDDERLMEQLHEALRAGAAVSDHHRRAAQAAFAWRTIDADLLRLSHDSLVGAQGNVRAAAPVEARVLSFEGRGVRLELELVDAALTGQLLPAQACRVTLQTPQGDAGAIDVDDSGFFEVEQIPSGPVRLQVQTDGELMISQWLIA